MDAEITELRKHTIEKILAKQDEAFRWGYDEKKARERPEYVYFLDDNIQCNLIYLLIISCGFVTVSATSGF